MVGAMRALGATMLLMITPLTAQSATPGEPPLSAAQTKVVSKAIAKLERPEERALASSMTNAKKVAEVICRLAALSALKKQIPGADRVFLGTNDPATLTLVSNKSLVGTGQVRSGANWTEFSFACELDPRSGKARSFTAKMTPGD